MIRKTKNIFIAVAVLMIIVVSQDIKAQQINEVANSFNIKAMVIKHITLISKRDLDFGLNVVPGITKFVDKSDANAGKFSFLGQPNREISIKFTLPSILNASSTEISSDNTGSKNTMSINFSSDDASFQSDGKVEMFNPTFIKNAKFGVKGTMDIFLGGTLMPAETQLSGYYNAIGNLSLQYVTN